MKLSLLSLLLLSVLATSSAVIAVRADDQQVAGSEASSEIAAPSSAATSEAVEAAQVAATSDTPAQGENIFSPTVAAKSPKPLFSSSSAASQPQLQHKIVQTGDCDGSGNVAVIGKTISAAIIGLKHKIVQTCTPKYNEPLPIPPKESTPEKPSTGISLPAPDEKQTLPQIIPPTGGQASTIVPSNSSSDKSVSREVYVEKSHSSSIPWWLIALLVIILLIIILLLLCFCWRSKRDASTIDKLSNSSNVSSFESQTATPVFGAPETTVDVYESTTTTTYPNGEPVKSTSSTQGEGQSTGSASSSAYKTMSGSQPSAYGTLKYGTANPNSMFASRV